MQNQPFSILKSLCLVSNIQKYFFSSNGRGIDLLLSLSTLYSVISKVKENLTSRHIAKFDEYNECPK